MNSDDLLRWNLRWLLRGKGEEGKRERERERLSLGFGVTFGSSFWLLFVVCVHFESKLMWTLIINMRSLLLINWSPNQWVVSYVARFAIVIGHQKYTCYNEIGQYVPSILTILGSTVNTIEKGLCDYLLRRKISSKLLHLKHDIEIWNDNFCDSWLLVEWDDCRVDLTIINSMCSWKWPQ